MTQTTALLMTIALNAAVGGTAVGVAVPLWQATYDEDAAIRRVFQANLDREPTASELRRYRVLMDEYGWSEADVSRDLRGRSDYQRYARVRSLRPNTIVRRAYQDILHREPDPSGLETYRRNIIENGWDEHDVRQALRTSPEKRQHRQALSDAQATEIVRRAYIAVLNREPDETGLRDYKLRILRDGWREQDVVQALRNSDEYRSKSR